MGVVKMCEDGDGLVEIQSVSLSEMWAFVVCMLKGEDQGCGLGRICTGRISPKREEN